MMDEEDLQFLQAVGLCPFERGEKDEVSPPPPRYQFLEPRRGSNYRQLFLKGRNIRAEVLYGQTLGEGSRTIEELAADYGLPIEAIQETVEYCIHNQDVLRQDWEEEEELDARLRAAPPILSNESSREA